MLTYRGDIDPLHVELSSAIEQLNGINADWLTEDLSRAVGRLTALLEDLEQKPETIDAILGDIEKLLQRSMLSNWDPAHLKIMEKEVAGSLRSYKAEMEADAYHRTFDLMLAKRMRDELGIPRLGLFYL